jgi:hypothetical protein
VLGLLVDDGNPTSFLKETASGSQDPEGDADIRDTINQGRSFPMTVTSAACIDAGMIEPSDQIAMRVFMMERSSGCVVRMFGLGFGFGK